MTKLWHLEAATGGRLDMVNQGSDGSVLFHLRRDIELWRAKERGVDPNAGDFVVQERATSHLRAALSTDFSPSTKDYVQPLT